MLWKKGSFELESSFQGTGFKGFYLVGGVVKKSHVQLSDFTRLDYGKRSFWQEATARVDRDPERRWCFLGDFNAVKSPEERKGVTDSSSRREMEEFQDFINKAALCDLPLIGRKYTWYKENGRAMSRIDRIVVSDSWLVTWPNIYLSGLKRKVSDHYPLVLKDRELNWGPKPFKTNDCWLLHDQFSWFVENQWKSTHIEGRKIFVFKEKLKSLKQALRKWNAEVFGHLDQEISKDVEVINAIDEKGETSQLEECDVNLRRGAVASMWKHSLMKESLLA